ncbi:MAG: hypothetical protein HQ525_11295, partial [Anaerolineae bacterium]|nr:hypothetical protein [Anaerolineae bacterium]
EEDGETIHAIWPFWAAEGGTGIRYVQLGKPPRINVDQELIQTQGQVRTTRLFIAQNESLHLLWANRPDTAAKWQLWYAQIDHEGNIQGELLQVSDANSGVSQYAVVEAPSGGVLVAWEDVLSGGINLIEISILGEKQANPTRVVEAGRKPDLWVDERGKIHLAWLDNDNNLLYARTDVDVASPLSGEKLLHIPLGTGATLDGPVLGVADGNVYLFWSVLSQSGLEAGTARTEYVFFPQGSPDKVSDVSRIDVLPLEEQPYRTDRGSYAYTELVPATYISNTSPYVYAPMVIQHPTGEMAIALATRQQYRLDWYVQIAVVVMEDGAYKGYTIATKTQAISSDPVLDADGAGNLHLIWRDGYSKETVYYTTTDAETRAELDRPTLRDMLTLVLTGGLESLTGILLFPLAFPWMFPGLIVLIIWRLIRNDEDLSNKVSVALLIFSVFMYQGSKILIFPTMVDYIPFSAWVDIPASWQLVLRIGVPLLILGIAIWVSEWSRNKQQSSSLRYYLVIVIVDTVLTLAIYGVNFLGAY